MPKKKEGKISTIMINLIVIRILVVILLLLYFFSKIFEEIIFNKPSESLKNNFK